MAHRVTIGHIINFAFMEKWDTPRKKQIDKNTGREVLTEPPHAGISWRDGYVLRSVPEDQIATSEPKEGGMIVGDDAFEWVPEADVDLA